MRATEVWGGTRARTERSPEASRFGEALRSARRRMVETGSAERAEERRESRAASPPRERRTTGTRAREEGTREERSGASPPAATRAGSVDPAPVGDAVASIVRALPVAIAAARAAGDGALALSFGRSLDVELRVGPAGVELVLRPEPRLLGAVTAELPRVVAALRARGVSVGRAEVRGRGGRPRPGRAR